ncbi:DUF4332 domain-containing protein [Thiopseudomonas denitrificans]|uniref:Uncharacterized protein DUF4332 n=1 Tax=Thiopseudomonas denitrificans TaxID=1501432 RepID=A0A4R6TZG7_9GAMM|nr:DUF4332 domain-containing protein [Thiopseudomonas denitrificans]TDQ39021.1 uncharacterized protein DUF4332 [Thiopseudomonas denitrificans]
MANYPIEDVEGIGPVMGEKLREVGIKDTDTLLQNVLTPKQRKELAEKTEISPRLILRFANMVDLYRINGVGSEYSELLEAAGVDTVPELAQRNAANLAKAMTEVNEEKNLTRRVPSETEVTKWVAQAKELPRMLEY